MKLIALLSLLISVASSAAEIQKEKKIIMAVFAHPDDEAVTNISAVLAKYAREGHDVYLVIATKGELGATRHAGIPAGDSLAKVRAGEALCTSNTLGIHPTILLGLGDGSLANDFTAKPVRLKLDSIFKQYKPDVIITWGPDGGYGHIDHRTVHNVVTELYQSGNMAKTKLYYAAMPTDVWEDWVERKSGKVGMYNIWKPVDKKFLKVRIKVTPEDQQKAISAANCHWSQFTKEQLEETERWMQSTHGVIYLRPFAGSGKQLK